MTAPNSSNLPGYEVIEEIGAGGMGVVFKAVQTALKRTVAIKMIRAGLKPGRQELARFRFEAEAVARLQHPNIVQVFAVNELDGDPYLVMEYVDGGSLARKIDGKAQPWRDAAAMLETLARAVHYAHSRGIIHRDLKPANVLLTGDATPKVADFGLAKPTDGQPITEGAGILGSPSYMAPEQAWGNSRIRDVGPAVDVYALGAVLYEMLTGRPPFKGTSSRATLEQVWRDRPAPPRSIVAEVPGDLEIICLKCLEKEAEKRYATAHELAEDLRRFRKGEPITARAVGRAERAWSWCRRNPLPAALLTALVVTFIAGFIGVTVKYFEAEDARQNLKIEALNARTAEGKANTAAGKAERAAAEAELAKKRALRVSYFTGIAAADGDYWANDLATAQERFRAIEIPSEGVGFEHHLLRRRLAAESNAFTFLGEEVVALANSPDGTRIAFIQSKFREINIVDANTGQEIHKLEGHTMWANCVAYSPSGKLIASGGHDCRLILWDAATGKSLGTYESAHGPLTDLAFNHDSTKLAAGNAAKTVTVWDVTEAKAAKEKLVFTKHAERMPLRKKEESKPNDLRLAYPRTSVAFTSDGKRIASSVGDYNWEQHAPLLLFRTALELGNDTKPGGLSRQAIVGAVIKETPTPCDVRLWEADTGNEIKQASCDTELYDLAFNDDGKLLAGGGHDGSIRVLDAATLVERRRGTGHTAPVRAVAFVGKSQVLASGGWDRTMRLWNLYAESPLPMLAAPAHHGRVNALAVNPATRRIVTGGSSRAGDTAFLTAKAEVKTWEWARQRGATAWSAHDGALTALAFSPTNPSLLVTASMDAKLIFWDWAKQQPLAQLKAPGPIVAMTMSPDGLWVAAAAGSTVFVIDAVKQTTTGKIIHPSGTIAALAFSPDSKQVAAVVQSEKDEDSVCIWQRESGTLICERKMGDKPKPTYFNFEISRELIDAAVIAFTSDGASLYVSGIHKPYRSLQSLLVPVKLEDPVKLLLSRYTFATNKSGSLVAWAERNYFEAPAAGATAGRRMDRTVILRNGGLDSVKLLLSGCRRDVLALALSPNGSRLAVVDADPLGGPEAEVRVWEMSEGRELLFLQKIDHRNARLAFSADGAVLAVGTPHGRVYIWNGAKGENPAENKAK